MIVVKLPSFTIGLAFSHPVRHENTGKLILDAEKGIYVQEMAPVRGTRCEVLEVEEGSENASPRTLPIIAVGTVRCDPRDNFIKETGRKKALKQALRVVHPLLTREERAIVWGTYLGRPRPVSTPSSSTPFRPVTLTDAQLQALIKEAKAKDRAEVPLQ